MFHAPSPATPLNGIPATLLAVLLCWGSMASAQDSGPAGEDGVEPDALLVAFAYNFCLFTKWPDPAEPGASRPFVILVVGKKIPAFDVLQKRTIRQRHVVVRQLPPTASTVPDACDVLICSGLDERRQSAILSAASGRPILTMSRTPGFCSAGGIVEFFVVERKMRFRVSRTNMALSGVRIQSRLLKLAVLVSGQEEGE